VEKTKSPTGAAGLLSLQMVRLSVLIAIGLALAAAVLAGLLSAALLLLTGLPDCPVAAGHGSGSGWGSAGS
jgi:hypothetical protein